MPVSIVLLFFHPQFIIGIIAPSALGPFSLVGMFFTSMALSCGGGFLERKAGRKSNTDLLCRAGNRSGAHEVRVLYAAESQLHTVLRPGWWVCTAVGSSVNVELRLCLL